VAVFLFVPFVSLSGSVKSSFPILMAIGEVFLPFRLAFFSREVAFEPSLFPPLPAKSSLFFSYRVDDSASLECLLFFFPR